MEALTPSHVSHQQSYERSRSTAVALTAVAIVILALSCVLWGFGTSPGMVLSGVGFVPYLAGTFLGAVAVGVLGGIACCTTKMIYHRCRASI